MTNAEMQKLNDSVQLCVRHTALENQCNQLQYSLNRTFISDEQYIKNALKSTWKHIWVLPLYYFIILGVVSMVLRGQSKLGTVENIIVNIIEWSFLIVGVILIVRWDLSTARKDCLQSEGYLANKRDREYMEANRDTIVDTLNDKRAELEELEEMMSDRSVCVIPGKYWGIAPQLLGLINDCRASSLQEAINLYHQLQREDARDKKIQLQLEYARDAYEAADRAADIAEQARRSAESAEKTAKDIDSYNRYGF